MLRGLLRGSSCRWIGARYVSQLIAITDLALTANDTADSNDWVNVQYVLKQSGGGTSDVSVARQNIISSAGSTAKNGPWSAQPLNCG